MEELNLKGKHLLQKIYDEAIEDRHWVFFDWFVKYKEQVVIFRKQALENKWTDDLLRSLVKDVDNGISGLRQGNFTWEEFEKIKNNWFKIQPVIHNIAKNTHISKEEYGVIVSFIGEHTSGNRPAGTNRIVAALLPNIVTTAVTYGYLRNVIVGLKNRLADYPEIQSDWLTDNINFVNYCNSNVEFKDSWHSSVFAWYLKEYFEEEGQLIQINEAFMQKYIDLLLNNKNLILTGAPGTGKTFLAKQIAEKITESKSTENEQSGIIELGAFITWMKNNPKSDGNSYSNNTMNSYRIAAQFLSSEYKGLSNLLSQIEEVREIYKPKTHNDATGSRSAVLTLLVEYSKLPIVNDRKYENVDKGNVAFVQFHPSYDYTDFVEGLRPVKIEGQSEIAFELKNGIFKEFCIKAFDNPNRNYVLIIDEINRAEISKVFGELFFSIDPSYRGIKGKIKTQYANMQTTETMFAEEYEEGEFFVPENVFIIGTMNDIDRSVESFDFAMRRRFTWVEITAEQSAVNMNLPEGIKASMLRLNEQISKIDGLNSSYHIGAAYFLDSNGTARQDIDNVWNMRIEPLLKEYLRGMPDGFENIEQLKKAFFAQ